MVPPFRLMWAHFYKREFQSLLLTAKTIRFEEPIRGTFTDVGTGLVQLILLLEQYKNRRN